MMSESDLLQSMTLFVVEAAAHGPVQQPERPPQTRLLNHTAPCPSVRGDGLNSVQMEGLNITKLLFRAAGLSYY